MTGDNGAAARGPLGYSSGLFALSDAQFVLLRNLILEHTGMFFDDAKRDLLADKLSELVAANALTSFLDYYYLLRYDEHADAHWEAVLNRLSVPETYFWRQPEQIQALARVVAPTHFATNPGRTLKIWCAACCTGEEPLSLAIALAEAGLLDRSPIEITATDGSTAMVARAKAARYGERSFRQLPTALREKYFERDGTLSRPIDRIRDAVTYGVVNLAQPAEVGRYAKVDVIFCRNVFIYFSDPMVKRVVDVFADHLSPDGCIFLGAAESLTRLSVELELAEVGGAFAYVKEGRRQLIERRSSITPAAEHRAARSKDDSWQG